MKSLLLSLLLALAGSLSAQEAGKVTVADVNFTLGDKWTSVEPSSPMRKATLQITATGSDKPLEANFFHFGGDIDSNIARWKGQVQGPEPKVEKSTIGGREVVFYHAEGTYTDPFGGLGAQENYALIGAMISVADQGPIVIKLAGPKDAVGSVKEAFQAMVKSGLAK
jgi:hypothetical protein